MARRGMSIVLILAVLAGAVMLLDGIGRLAEADSVMGRGARGLGTQASTINIVVAIIELVAGAIVVLSQFMSLGKLDSLLKLAVFIAWIVVIVLLLFVGGFAIDTLAWWIALAQSGIILAVIWLVRGGR